MRGLTAAVTAAEGFTGLDQFGPAARSALAAAAFESDRREAAGARLRQLRAACAERGENDLVQLCTRRLKRLDAGT